MAKYVPYAAIQPDEFEAFIGPNVEKFERARVGLQENKIRPGWLWLAFLAPPVWLIYRKLYLGFFILIGLVITLIILGIYFGIEVNTGTAVSIALAMGGRHLVVYRAAKVIGEADEKRLTGEERLDFLRRRGGVSKLGGWTSGIIYALLMGLLVLAVIYGS